MASIRSVRRGLEIIARHVGEETHLAGADHDIIWSPADRETLLTEEEKAELEDLGWHVDSESGCWSRFC